MLIKLLLTKIAAIFFLSVLCFNCVGYRYVFDYLDNKYSNQLNAKLNNGEYDESSLISIKTTISVPYGYLAKSTEFERWNGEIEIGGVKYHYVKRRFFRDSLELLCIPNMVATKMKEAKQDFVKSTSDQQNDNGKQDQGKIPSFKNLLSEYSEQVPEWCIALETAQQVNHSFYLQLISQHKEDTPCQPPDAA
jgi:hypothetical protein